MYKNGKMYNLEVLYDEISNTVYYFEYARKAMETCQQLSGFLYTNENCKTHPAYLHEHTWNWSDGIPKRSK